ARRRRSVRTRLTSAANAPTRYRRKSQPGNDQNIRSRLGHNHGCKTARDYRVSLSRGVKGVEEKIAVRVRADGNSVEAWVGDIGEAIRAGVRNDASDQACGIEVRHIGGQSRSK